MAQNKPNVAKNHTSLASLLKRHRMFLEDITVTPEQLLSLSLRIKGGQRPDYEKEASIFAVLYFLENLSKCKNAAGHLLQHGNQIRVLDIGSGSGASVCGVVLGLEHYCPSRLNLEFTCIERSPSQEKLFRRITLPWLKRLGVSVKLERCDALNFLRNCRDPYDFVVLSFVLIEMTEAERSEVKELLRNKGQFRDYLIIDKSPEGGSYAVYSNGAVIPLRYGSCETEKDSLPEILKKYFLSWQFHDFRMLRRIFHDQATYRIDSARTLKGFSEIKQYWVQNAREQKDVNWRVLNFVNLRHLIIAEWESTFSREGIPYRLYGFLKIEHSGGRIVRFHEAYKKLK